MDLVRDAGLDEADVSAMLPEARRMCGGNSTRWT
jgi:hypothetical protein